MTIPQSFTAGGLYWTVQMSDTLMEEHQKYGRTKFKAQVIELDSTISHALQMATFLHELMHVAVWNSGVDKAIKALRNETTEEILVNSLSNAMFQIMADNGMLV